MHGSIQALAAEGKPAVPRKNALPKRVYHAVRLTGPAPKVDGKLDDWDWSGRIWIFADSAVRGARLAQANLKLYPILRALGMDDQSLGEAWGKDILEARDTAATARFARVLESRVASGFADDGKGFSTFQREIDPVNSL